MEGAVLPTLLTWRRGPGEDQSAAKGHQGPLCRPEGRERDLSGGGGEALDWEGLVSVGSIEVIPLPGLSLPNKLTASLELALGTMKLCSQLGDMSLIPRCEGTTYVAFDSFHLMGGHGSERARVCMDLQ